MNQKYIWIGLGILAVIVAAVLIVNNSTKSEIASEQSSNNGMMAKEDSPVAEEKDTQMMAEDKMETGDSMMESAGSYKDYSASTVNSEQQAGNKVVLFFHAPWCPFCKTADAAFKANLNKIPAGVAVLKTDYDSNTELRKQYGVTYQHTFVQIDAQGSMVTKWTGGDIDALIKNLK